MISRTGPTRLGRLGAILLTGLLLPGAAAVAGGHVLPRPPSQGIPEAGLGPHEKVASLPSLAESCAGIPGDNLGCPRSSSLPSPEWFNTTAPEMYPGSQYLDSTTTVAFDPQLDRGELVAFGDSPTEFRATWMRNVTGWHDLTPSLSTSPPDLQGEEMDYDPGFGGILLVGEFVAGSGPPVEEAETWLFNATGWHDLTNETAPPTGTPPTLYGGNMAWDGAIDRMVYANGCVATGCGDGEISQTLELGSVWTSLGKDSGPGGGTSLDLQASAMAYDPVLGDLVFFGGFNTSYYDNGFPATGWTYLFNGTGWLNDTSRLQACEPACAYPGARAYAGMTWDGQLGRIILAGGSNTTASLTDTWTFNGTGWMRLPAAALGYPDGGDSDLLVNASAVAPFLFEYPYQVLELRPEVAGGSFTPTPVDVAAPTQLVFPGLNGTGSGPQFEYSISTGTGAWVNGTLTVGANPSSWAVRAVLRYSVPGSYDVKVSVTDFYGVVGDGSATLRVNPLPVASFTVAPNVTEVGAPVYVSAQASLGSGPYVFAWSYGDGTTSSGATSSHAYSAAGVYTIQLNTTDQGGGSDLSTAFVWIQPSLDLRIFAASLAGEEGVPIQFTAVPSGGTGEYSPVFWNFGDGGSALGSSVRHSFNAFGYFDVSASLTDTLGFFATAHIAVAINVSVTVISAYVQPQRVVAGVPVQFYLDTGGGVGPVSIAWAFGDGSLGNGPSPSHTYVRAGNFSVTAWANDTLGGSSRFTFQVQVASLPSLGQPPPTGPAGPGPSGVPLSVFLAFAAVVAVGLGGVIALLLRRERRNSSV
jgi:PKD repeat protein